MNVVISPEIAARAEGRLEQGGTLFGLFDPSRDTVLCRHKSLVAFLGVVVFSHYGKDVLSTRRKEDEEANRDWGETKRQALEEK